MKTHPIATRSRRDALLHAALKLVAQPSCAATPVSAVCAGHLNLNDERIAVAEERVWKLFER
jgi:hypothetical protein